MSASRERAIARNCTQQNHDQSKTGVEDFHYCILPGADKRAINQANSTRRNQFESDLLDHSLQIVKAKQ